MSVLSVCICHSERSFTIFYLLRYDSGLVINPLPSEFIHLSSDRGDYLPNYDGKRRTVNANKWALWDTQTERKMICRYSFMRYYLEISYVKTLSSIINNFLLFLSTFKLGVFLMDTFFIVYISCYVCVRGSFIFCYLISKR